jgi:hypothetical protein
VGGVPRFGRLLFLFALAALGLPAAASAQASYKVPQDNPFVGQAGAAPEVYALGLRNPFRWSFDRANGDLTIGDVGQAAKEEIDFVPSGAVRGANFEWACREGSVAGPKACTPGNAFPPVLDYDNPPMGSSSVTGGYVSRDPALPSFAGRYFYADFFENQIRTTVLSPGSATPSVDENVTVGSPVAFGEDAAGGLYVVSLGGVIYRLGENAGALTATVFAQDLDAPMNLAAPPGDTGRVFIVERDGRVLLRSGGTTTTFLDIRSQVSASPGERGMSSVAFPPDYATSGRFYVYYSDTANIIRVDEFRRSATNPNDAAESSQRHVLAIDHTASNNHYGGQMHFGPDRYLYVSTGDGGGSDDQFDNAQNLSTLLGKLLRIDPVPDALPGGPVADTRPPRLLTKTKRRQRVLRLGGVVVYARCPGEACNLSITARVRIGRLSYPLKRVRRPLAKNKRVRLKAKLTKSARKVLRKALHDGRRARVDVAIRARDKSGNRSTLRRVTVRVRGQTP